MFAIKNTQNLPKSRFHCKYETCLKGKFANVCITIQSARAQPQAELCDLKSHEKYAVFHIKIRRNGVKFDSFILNCEDILNETSEANAITMQIARAQVKAEDNMLCKTIIIKKKRFALVLTNPVRVKSVLTLTIHLKDGGTLLVPCCRWEIEAQWLHVSNKA